MEIMVKLTVEEINLLLTVLGQMPNSSGTYLLLLKIRQQGVDQVKQSPTTVEVISQ